MRLTTRDGWWRFAEAMAADVPFRTSGALYSSRGGGHVGGRSQLPAEFREAVRHAAYVVYSYETPIAWRDGDGDWTVPDVQYRAPGGGPSRTTSRHQNTVRMAVGDIEAYPGKYE